MVVHFCGQMKSWKESQSNTLIVHFYDVYACKVELLVLMNSQPHEMNGPTKVL